MTFLPPYAFPTHQASSPKRGLDILSLCPCWRLLLGIDGALITFTKRRVVVESSPGFLLHRQVVTEVCPNHLIQLFTLMYCWVTNHLQNLYCPSSQNTVSSKNTLPNSSKLWKPLRVMLASKRKSNSTRGYADCLPNVMRTLYGLSGSGFAGAAAKGQFH